ADGFAAGALDRHPDTEAGMLVVVLEYPDIEKRLSAGAALGASEVSRHLVVGVQRAQPLDIRRSEATQREPLRRQPEVHIVHAMTLLRFMTMSREGGKASR